MSRQIIVFVRYRSFLRHIVTLENGPSACTATGFWRHVLLGFHSWSHSRLVIPKSSHPLPLPLPLSLSLLPLPLTPCGGVFLINFRTTLRFHVDSLPSCPLHERCQNSPCSIYSNTKLTFRPPRFVQNQPGCPLVPAAAVHSLRDRPKSHDLQSHKRDLPTRLPSFA